MGEGQLEIELGRVSAAVGKEGHLFERLST
jgi:hypothetical protein